MRSRWITYKNKKIFYQDFSGHDFIDAEAVKKELAEVQEVVVKEPEGSVLVLADFRDTPVGKDLMDLMIPASKLTKAHVKKTAVLGVRGTKRILADMLVHVTGQALSLFEDEESAKEWLIK